MALGHALFLHPIPSPLDSVFSICQEHCSAEGSLHIAASAALTALTPGWYFGIRQQDAAEYLALLLELITPEVWQSRLMQAGIALRDEGMIITLDLSSSQTCLQQLIREWHAQHYTHALCSVQPVLCLQLGRYPGHRKLPYPINLPNTVDLPSFTSADSLSVRWVSYSLASVIVHLGRSPSSGHYRTLLKADGCWHYTNDHARSQRTVLQQEHLRGSYILLLTPAAQP